MKRRCQTIIPPPIDRTLKDAELQPYWNFQLLHGSITILEKQAVRISKAVCMLLLLAIIMSLNDFDCLFPVFGL